MVNSIIRNRVHKILDKQIQGSYQLFYSSLLDQLYILYFMVGGIVLMLFAHLAIWPIAVIIIYIVTAYLFGTYRNHCFALTHDKLYVVNGRKPFIKCTSIGLSEIKEMKIGTNKHPFLDRIFIIPSNVFVEILLKNNNSKEYYTNVEFKEDVKVWDLSLEDLQVALMELGIVVSMEEKNELFD
jgi:hypothetical protein